MKKIFLDLDYFRSKDGIIYLIKGYYHPKGFVFAYPVFWPDKKGERHHPKWGNYRKEVSDFNQKIFKIHPEYRHTLVPVQTPLIPYSDITEVFNPKKKVRDFINSDHQTIWYQLFQYLTDKLKISPEDIGIFGSYLVGLHKDQNNQQIKDVDFIIYGKNNLFKVRQNIDKLISDFGFSHISKDHILYHAQKFGQFFDPKINSFQRTLANKWSSIQIAPGLLNTLRFVYQENEIPPNPITSPIDHPLQIKGRVTYDIGTNFVPRIFNVKTEQKVYRIVTYFWGFQACVKRGDMVMITGDLHQDKKTISVDQPDHGIKILV